MCSICVCLFIGIETLSHPRTWLRAPKQGWLLGHGVTDDGPNGGLPRPHRNLQMPFTVLALIVLKTSLIILKPPVLAYLSDHLHRGKAKTPSRTTPIGCHIREGMETVP